MILSDWYEPAYKAGGPIRSCANLAQAMSGRYAVYVLAGDRDLDDTKPFVNQALDKWVNLDHGIKVYYLSRKGQGFRGIKRIIRDLNPDQIYLNSMYSFPFTIVPLLLSRFRGIDAELFLAPRGMLQKGAISYKSRKKKIFLFLLRLLGFDRRIYWHATSEQEVQDIKQFFPKASAISLISNLPSFRQEPLVFREKAQGALNLAFISRLTPIKNLTYLLQALQHVKAEIRLDIGGPIESKDYWDTCQDLIKLMPANVQISYLGPLKPDEVGQVLKKNHIFVLPTEGENFGHAIFEALLLGKPVVISHLTPWQDLEENQAGLLVSLDDPKVLAKHIEHFASLNTPAFEMWAKGAWLYAKRFLEQSDLPNQYDQMFKNYGGK